MKRPAIKTACFAALFFLCLVAGCVRNADGSISYTKSMAQWLNGGGSNNKGVAAETMTIPELLKELMIPSGSSINQKSSKTNSVTGKDVNIILPGGYGSIQGHFAPLYPGERFKKNGAYEELEFFIAGDSDNVWQLPLDLILKQINNTPDMKITSLLQTLGMRHSYEYYRVECTNREPVILSSEDEIFFKNLTLHYNLPTTKNALKKALNQ